MPGRKSVVRRRSLPVRASRKNIRQSQDQAINERSGLQKWAERPSIITTQQRRNKNYTPKFGNGPHSLNFTEIERLSRCCDAMPQFMRHLHELLNHNDQKYKREGTRLLNLCEELLQLYQKGPFFPDTDGNRQGSRVKCPLKVQSQIVKRSRSCLQTWTIFRTPSKIQPETISSRFYVVNLAVKLWPQKSSSK